MRRENTTGAGLWWMSVQRNTYLCIEDIPDTPNAPVDIEGEQEQALIERIGLAMWGHLQQREMEDDHVPKRTP